MHLPIELPGHPGSYVLATDAAGVDTAVVFVHGFGGDALKTWLDFHSLIDDDERFRNADCYFFQYNSFGNSIRNSSSDFRKLLEELREAPEAWFTSSPGSVPRRLRRLMARSQAISLRTGPTAYQQLVLVGHSLGGVVLRHAIRHHANKYADRILDAAPGVTVPWILRAGLRLFSPAISGVRPAGLKGVALRLGGLRTLARVVLGGSPSYAALDPARNYVGKLRDDTEAYAAHFTELPAFRADILWARPENIVEDEAYNIDEDEERRGKSHTAVCKPTKEYLDPLDLVVNGL